MVKQFIWDLGACGDLDKIRQGNKILWDRGMPGIPQENTPKGEKWECIKACYVMRVVQSIEGEIIDANHPNHSWEQNIWLHDIVSPVSMNQIEKNGQTTVSGKTLQGKADYRYCPLCLYASQNHQMLNNHVWLHFCISMVCVMPDCWFMSHNAHEMWKHVASHRLATAEPIVKPKSVKKK